MLIYQFSIGIKCSTKSLYESYPMFGICTFYINDHILQDKSIVKLMNFNVYVILKKMCVIKFFETTAVSYVLFYILSKKTAPKSVNVCFINKTKDSATVSAHERNFSLGSPEKYLSICIPYSWKYHRESNYLNHTTVQQFF